MDCAGTKQQSAPTERCREYLLPDLLHSVTYSVLGKISPAGILVSGVVTDSRKVTGGSLFVAMTGSRTDGHAYLRQVMACDCAALVVEEGKVDPEIFADCRQCVIMVPDSHLAYARIAANLHGNPARDLTLVGITGTNGKTTVSYLLESVLRQKGLAVGVIGTVNYRYRDAAGLDVEMPAPFTTPEPLLLQALLRRMADAGVTHVIMEVSSHALVQHRLGDLCFDVVAYTNLSRDHLDYHRNMEEYFAAKALLFADHLKPGGAAVITRSAGVDPEEKRRAGQLAALAGKQGAAVLRCNRVGESDVYPLHVQSGLDSTSITLRVPCGFVIVNTPLVGDFNVENLQTAVALSLALGMDAQSLVPMLRNASGAPGRLQRVMPAAQESHFRPAVFVDYAHSPDALEKVLATLSRLPHRKMICVFGCGGDRDKGKRAIMGGIAGFHSNVVVVTDDNPRTESPAEIVAQIVTGVRSLGLQERELSWIMVSDGLEKGFVVIHDRAAAIAAAVGAATDEDIVLIAGKGHERYQQGREGRRFFDDSLEAGKALTNWTLESVCLATGGELNIDPVRPRRSAPLGAVVTDSRKVAPGDIFVALAGERFDGHDFLEQVVAAGAGCLVVRRDFPRVMSFPSPCLLVDDTLQALGDLAAYRRRLMRAISQPQSAIAPVSREAEQVKVRPLVVGITGSCGKTTVKEMTAAIFEQHWPSAAADPQLPVERVLKTKGNFNNLVGLPLSLLPVGPEHEAVILEMGMNRPGEIDRLARIAEPDIACIVNVHAAHLEGLHSLEGVARAKEELFAASRKNTVLVVNLDDPLVRACAEGYRQEKIFYAAGIEEGLPLPQVWASEIGKGDGGTQDFVLHIGEKTVPVSLPVPGVHNVSNAVAAAAIGHAAGIGIKEIGAGLAVFRPADKRMQIVQGKGGLNILNDTYNANPASMRAGLATLGRQQGCRRVAILGDMLELGPASGEAHREAGRYAAAQELDYLALTGDFAGETAAGARQAGMESQRVRIFAEKKEIAHWIEELLAAGRLQAGDWVLVKGSRGMRLEAVVEQLTGETG